LGASVTNRSHFEAKGPRPPDERARQHRRKDVGRQPDLVPNKLCVRLAKILEGGCVDDECAPHRPALAGREAYWRLPRDDGSTPHVAPCAMHAGRFLVPAAVGHQGLNRDAIVDLKVARHKNCVGAPSEPP
jgi:hypothetical protein